MQGLMMQMPLTITSIMRHAEQVFGDREIVSMMSDGNVHRYTYADSFTRVRQLANVFRDLGIEQGDCIGTLAWNDYRHFEIYYATACSGAICHTINPRLFPEQIEYIINHAEDSWLFIDLNFIPLVEQLLPKLTSVKGVVLMCDEQQLAQVSVPKESMPNVHCYEQLLKSADADFELVDVDENTASGMCYTSGTTGNPKGVVYSHRSTVLHSMGAVAPDAMCLSQNDVLMPIVPMFHVNAWGCPYSAPLVGAKLVFPGNRMADGASLQHLIEAEQVTVSAGVPTIWLALLDYLDTEQKQVESLNRIFVGGAACPLSIVECFGRDYQVSVQAAWGMTETSPVGTINTLTVGDPEPKESTVWKDQVVKPGRPLFGVEMRLVDDNGKVQPRDGEAVGELQVRGPWIASGYFREDAASVDWFPTGDIANIDQQSFMKVTDRSKDVIKSGGEWISSIALENVATDHPSVAEAAVIAIPHPKWTERPLLIAVVKHGEAVTEQELLDWFDGKVASWWIPEQVKFVDEIPHTATGKVQKMKLREQYVPRE